MEKSYDTYAREVMLTLPGSQWAWDAVSALIKSGDPNSWKDQSTFLLNLLINGVPIVVIALINGWVSYVVWWVKMAKDAILK
jgi:hypothetical protein